MVSDSGTETGENSLTATARTALARLAVDSRADCDGAQFLHSER
ncbi:hypothetical protein HSR121_1606 [Halapricum desulfuricans]|uniref:Uncharacterized protein n=1 Tax=Halapricum desulfuricans TaxID=2841257 RepID=A0A897N3T0_9EURY|nr:hypothetical protein HSR121_1606 [Halapricum desulfuricans]